MTRRVDQSWDEVPVTFNNPNFRNFLWRCVDGKYRGAGPTGSKPQATWNKTHARATEILGTSADPNENYALTEVVHCKSKGEVGVAAALPMCTSKWLMPIMSLANQASVVVLAGSKVRNGWARDFFDLHANYGKGNNSLSVVERAIRDTFVSDKLGQPRLVAYMGQPAFSPSFVTMYGDCVTQLIGEIAQGEREMPASTNEWHQLLVRRCGVGQSSAGVLPLQ